MSTEASKISEFLIARGGPFYELQRQLRLLSVDAYRARSRAALFVGLAWGGPLVLSLFAGTAWGAFADEPYLLSLAAWSRFFIAVGLFILMERAVEVRLRSLLAHFARAPILAPRSFAAAAEAVTDALRRRDALLAEVVCLILAVVPSILLNARFLHQENSSWSVQVTSGGNVVTLAGWWCLLLSNPLFCFLLLRWLWRLQLWSMMLRRIAKLELRLVATHPDGHGGLAFIGRYPNAYTMFVFAVSCVLAAAVAHELLDEGISARTYGFVMSGWLMIVLGLLTYPLLAFHKPLAELKAQTLYASSAQATKHFLARERDILGKNISGAVDTASQPAPVPDPTVPDPTVPDPTVPDPTATYSSANKLSTILVNRSALLPVSVAALLPLVAAGASQLPIKEILRVAKRLLLL